MHVVIFVEHDEDKGASVFYNEVNQYDYDGENIQEFGDLYINFKRKFHINEKIMSNLNTFKLQKKWDALFFSW